jgi:predicted acylesterase/phospholipase RssA
VDAIAGTSMGRGGGLYASGMSAAEIEKELDNTTGTPSAIVRSGRG